MAMVTSLTAKLAMKKLVTFCILCDDATTHITNKLPIIEISEMVPYKVHKSTIISEKIIMLVKPILAFTEETVDS